MEILSLLRLTIWRIIGLSVIAALAALGTTKVVLDQPAQYETTATVFVGQALPTGANPFEIAPRVSEFQTAMELASVLEGAKEQTGLDDSYLQVTSTRQGEGSTVKVTSTGPEPEGTQASVSAISEGAIEFMVTYAQNRALQAEASARATRDAAAVRVNELIDANGSVNPIVEYETAQSQLSEYDFRATSPTLTALERAAYIELATGLRTDLPGKAQDAGTYRQADAQLEAAEARFAAATQVRADADATYTSATSANVIALGETTELSRISSLATGVLAGVLAVFALGIAFFLLYDTVTGNGAPIRRHRIAVERAEQPIATEVPQTFEGAVYADAVRPISFGTNGDGGAAREQTRPGTPTEILAHKPVQRDHGRRRNPAVPVTSGAPTVSPEPRQAPVDNERTPQARSQGTPVKKPSANQPTSKRPPTKASPSNGAAPTEPPSTEVPNGHDAREPMMGRRSTATRSVAPSDPLSGDQHSDVQPTRSPTDSQPPAAHQAVAKRPSDAVTVPKAGRARATAGRRTEKLAQPNAADITLERKSQGLPPRSKPDDAGVAEPDGAKNGENGRQRVSRRSPSHGEKKK